MNRPLIFAAAATVAMTVIASRAETVRPYERKDGTHVSTYDRNSSRTGLSAPTPVSSLDYNAIYSTRDDQQNSGQSVESDGQSPVIVTTTERPSTTTPYKIISDEWVSDTLNVYGTLSGSNVIQSVIGFDKNQRMVTESYNYTIESDGTFHARLTDPKKEIRFLKVVVTGRVAEVHQQASAPAPIASVHTDGDSPAVASLAVLVVGVVVGLIWFIVASASKGTSARAVLYFRQHQANQRIKN